MKSHYLTLRWTILLALALQLILWFTPGTYGAQVPIRVRPAPAQASAAFPDLYEASIAELQAGLEREQFTSVDLVTVSRALTCTSLYKFTNFNPIGLSCED